MNRKKQDSSKKFRINERLRRIANVLLLNASFIDNLGLLNGKMGIAIFFYQYARYTGSKIFEDYAGSLIDEIYEELSLNTPIDFANGLTGIGWGIEYLVRNGFVEADTDEILENIDNTVYQKIFLEFNYQELQGFLLFQLTRFQEKRNENSQQEFLKKHTILLLLNECEKLVVYHRFKEQIIFPDQLTIKTIQYFVSEVEKTGLFPAKTSKLLNSLQSFLEIATVNKEAERETLVDQATKMIWQQLVYPSDENPIADLKLILSEVFNFIDIDENWNSYLINQNINNWGLNKGLAGIGMTLLRLMSYLNPQNVEVLKTKIATARQADNVPSIFIFKSNARGMQYGIGTYIRELTNALLNYTNIKLYVVTYNCSDCNEFSVETISSRFFKINIPSPKVSTSQNNQFYERYGSVAVKLLSDVIPKNGEVVFQMNYIDDLPIIKKLKETYTYPIVSIVHFAQWQQIFNGNRQKLNGLNIDNPSNNIEFTLCREKEMYQLSDHIISVTRYMKDFLIEEYGIMPDKIDIVPNGIDCSSFKTISPEEKLSLKLKMGFSPNEKVIVFSGRIDPCKGILFLIDAFIEVCKQNSDLRLVIIGQGDINDCLKRSDSFYGKMTYTGFLPSNQLMALYQVADMGIVPSVYDHCPYTVLEMIANKIPLIVSKINGLDEILDDNQCLFVNPVLSEEGDISFNIKELSDAILTLAENNTMRNELAIKSNDNLRNRFAASRMAEEMNNLFHTLKKSNIMSLEYEKS